MRFNWFAELRKWFIERREAKRAEELRLGLLALERHVDEHRERLASSEPSVYDSYEEHVAAHRAFLKARGKS